VRGRDRKSITVRHRRLGFPANQSWVSLCLKLNLTALGLLGLTGRNGYVDYLVFVKFLLVKRTLFAWSRGLPKQVFRFARYVPPQEGGSLPLKRVRGVSLHAGLVFVCADGLRLPSRSSHW